jgi:predicted nucleotidyltransferase
MHLTDYADVDELLGALLSGVRDVLGEKLVGLYLYGSLVWGDFDHELSDIDLLAATTTDIDDEEFDALKRMHDALAARYPSWDDRIEVQYLSLEGLKTFRTESTKMAVISPGEPFHMVEANRDWLMNWYFVQDYGKTLFGPPPGTIIDPIGKEEFIRSIVEHAKAWPTWVDQTRHSRPYQGYAVLTMCRTLYTFRNGVQVSKKQAAAWAETELPEWAPLIRSAIRWREEKRQDLQIDHEATFPETKRFVQFISEQIAPE